MQKQGLTAQLKFQNFAMVLDIDALRVDRGGDPDKVRKNQISRFCDPGLVDTALLYDDKWKKGLYFNILEKKEYFHDYWIS